jgi:DNA-binding GntR family transcriptional regulator
MNRGPIKRRTAKQEVTVRLRERIASGDLEPGTKLNLKATALQLGVSMTPVREAFEQLSAEGLVKADAFKGARVAPLSAEEYQEIFLLRAGLEALAHRLGCTRMTDALCDELEECLQRMDKAHANGDVVSFVRHDRRFHEIIYAASGRDSLRDRLMSLRIAAERYTRAVMKMPKGGMQDTVCSHRDILEACRKRDGRRAERIITDDLRLTYDSFVESCGGTALDGD